MGAAGAQGCVHFHIYYRFPTFGGRGNRAEMEPESNCEVNGELKETSDNLGIEFNNCSTTPLPRTHISPNAPTTSHPVICCFCVTQSIKSVYQLQSSTGRQFFPRQWSCKNQDLAFIKGLSGFIALGEPPQRGGGSPGGLCVCVCDFLLLFSCVGSCPQLQKVPAAMTR